MLFCRHKSTLILCIFLAVSFALETRTFSKQEVQGLKAVPTIRPTPAQISRENLPLVIFSTLAVSLQLRHAKNTTAVNGN